MSSIIFDADFDNKKLEAGIKQSNKTMAEFVKETEKAGEIIDNTFVNVGKTVETVNVNINKYGKSVVGTIEEQKKLIKSIEDDVKNLQKTFDKMAPGKSKFGPEGMTSELSAAKRALKEEYAQLTKMQEKFLSDQKKLRFNNAHAKALVENAKRDRIEFNKLHQQALKENVEYDKSHKSLIENVLGGLKKWVIGLVSVGAALKIAKSIIDSTETSSQKFERVIAGASAGVQYFFKSIASGDWTNFFSNMDRAIRGASEFVDKMQDIENKQNEQKIKSSEYDLKISELRDATYDKDESNNEARKKALTEIIELQKIKYKEESDLAKEAYQANLKKAATDSGLSEKQIENFIKEYSSLEKLIEVGEKYNEITNLTRKPGLNAQYVASLYKERDALGANATEAGKYVQQIGKVTDETRKQLSDFAASAIEAESAFGQKNRRDKMQLAEVTNKIKADEEESKKKAIEDAKLENRIAEQKELLNKAIEKGNITELKAIGTRIAELEKELEVRQKIAKSIIDNTGFEGFVPTAVSAEGIGTPSVLPQQKKKTVQKQWQEIREEMTSLRPISDELIKAGKEADKIEIEAQKQKIENQKQLIAGASELVYLAGEQLGLGEEELKVLDAKLQAIGQFASGNYVGAAITTVLSVISGFMSLLPNQSAKLDKQIEHINELLVEQQRLIELSSREGGQTSARKKELEELQKLRDVQEEAIKRAEKTLSGGDFWNSGAKMKKAQQTWEEMTAAIKETDYSILQATQDLNDFFTGTDQQSIASAISEGLRDSESMAEYADRFYSFMRDAIDNALQDALSVDLTPWYKQFAADMASGGGLSTEETANLKKWYDEIIERGKANREAAFAIAGISKTPSDAIDNGLSMGIRRDISEQTGTELAGLFRRFADDNRTTKDYTLAGLNHLVGIERNTAETVTQLQFAVSELKNIVSNTKQSAVGTF